MKNFIVTALSIATLSVVPAWANEPVMVDLAKRQARSVHLQYMTGVKDATSIRGTVTVRESQPNSYFCLFGWDCGYCGIQDKGQKGKVLIFSVWDPVDPFDFTAREENVKEEHRAKVLYANPAAEVARFSGEGSGARTMTPYEWKVGEPITIQVDAEADGTNHTAFTCSVYDPATKGWLKIATLSTLHIQGRASGFNGIYSFVEDFWRNYHSATLSRHAEYSQIAVRPNAAAEWRAVTRAMFSGDNTPSAAIDAGRTATGAFYLKTGGQTKNTHTKLWNLVD